MKNKAYKPCCKKFKKIAVRYCDFVSNDDYALRMLAELLLRSTDDFPPEGRDLRTIGHQIEQYLNRKVVLESWLFNRSLCLCSFDDAEIKIEKLKVQKKLFE